MNPVYLLSELAWVARSGIGLASRVRLATDCVAARIPGVWSRDRQVTHQVRVRIHGKPFVVALRNNGSDVRILTSLLKDGEYEAPGLNWGEIDTIIDAGANIGITSLYFHSLAPNARIVAVEPEPGNLQVLRRNVDLNAIGAEIVPAALWKDVGTMSLEVHHSAMAHKLTEAVFNDEGGTGDGAGASIHGQVDGDRPRTGGSSVEVATVNMPALLARFAARSVDLVKLDIEGAERAVLERPDEWIHAVKRFVIECHPEQGLSSSQVEAILRTFGFETEVYRPHYDLLYAHR